MVVSHERSASTSAAITAPPVSIEPPGPKPSRPGPRSPAWPRGHKPSWDRPSCDLSRPEPIKLTVTPRMSCQHRPVSAFQAPPQVDGAAKGVAFPCEKLRLNCPILYRPRFVRHRIACYAARAADESWLWRMAAGVWNPCRSMSQVVL